MRKVLSFVLVLTLVLSSFSMAFAATPAAGLSDIAGIANEDAIQVNYDLGIVTGNPDGTFLPSKTVTRAEFAAMITRALAIPDSALAGYTATSFKDTTGYGWAVPYLAFCQSKGIMLGDGAGNVMPGRTINTNEAMTMALRAIGYTSNSAQLVGAWPSNYVSLAQNNDLYDDVANVVNVDKANAAQIIYNLLTVQKVSVNSDGETIALWQDAAKTDASCLLNTGLGAEATDAQVIAGDEDSTINLVPYTGAYVVAYEKDDEIVAIGEVKSTFLEGDFGGAPDNYFTADDVDYKGMTTATAIATYGAYFLNGEDKGLGTVDAIGDAPTDVVIAVDLSGKTIKELYSIAEWDWTAQGDAAVVDAADLEAIDDEELLGSEFILDDDDNIDLKSFELVGVASLDKIAKDNVVYVYANAANEIKKVAVGTEVVTGKVTEVDGDDYTIGGKVYNLAGTTNAGSETPVAGDTVTAKLDAYGDIFDCDIDGGTADTYGVIKAYAAAGINDEQIKLYTDADDTTTFDINDDATVTLAGALTKGSVGTLVGYALDKDGDIDTLDVTSSSSALATLSSLSVLKVTNGGVDTYPVDADCVVITKDGSGAYDVTTLSKVKTGEALAPASGFQFILDDGTVVAMLIADTAAGASDTDTYAVVDKATSTVNADDDSIQRIIGFANGAAFDKYTDDDDDIIVTKTAINVYKVDIDADGIVTKTTVQTVGTTGTIATDGVNDAKTAVKIGTDWYALADGAYVYKAEANDDGNYEYSVSSANSLRETYTIYLYETDDDVDGYDVIVFVK